MEYSKKISRYIVTLIYPDYQSLKNYWINLSCALIPK